MRKVISAAVEISAASGLTVAETKTVTIRMRSPNVKADVVEVEAAGPRCKQVKSFCLSRRYNNSGDVTTDVNRGINKAWKCFVKYGRPIYDHSYIALAENVRFLRAKKVNEIMPQGCVI